ncbi:MAG: hypothetical protein ABWK01_07940 [Infirmifilum sp.]
MGYVLHLTPEDIIARARAQLTAKQLPSVILRPAGTGSSLYGVFVKVEGIGIIGQYIGHIEYTVSGPDGPEEMWEITYGYTELFARIDSASATVFIPVAFGAMSKTARRLIEAERPPLYEHKEVRGSITVPKRALVNLDDVMAGRDFVLRVDPYGVTVPTDIRERAAELGRQLEVVRRAYTLLQREYERERSRREVAEAQLASLLSVHEELKGRLATTEATVRSAETMLLDMRSRISALSTRVATERELREQLASITEDLAASIETARKALAAARTLISEAVEAVGQQPEEKPEEKEEKGKPPPPQEEKPEEREEGEAK